MVGYQLEARGIRDRRVLEAMRRVPRHEFVPEEIRHRAYDDAALPIGEGQTISQPYMVAAMTELLELKGGEKVLEVGTGSGYQAAVLAELAREVYTIELHEELSERAREIIGRLGYRNVHFRTGDGTLGLPGEAPFQAIIVTAGSPAVPKPLADQLDEGGVIVIPVGERYSQRLLAGRKIRGKLHTEYGIYCVFVPLAGAFGWRE
jgi:protein-L-isoaspartate(D-aspartate) O-methyltransferase